jgi:DNA-binding NarL/FixJ family response regulator
MSVIQILLVDAFVPWQLFLREMLESDADFKIIGTANDGLEAVHKATEARPDIILMDISLPKLNGFEAAQHIRMLSPASRILFLTEHRGSDFIDAAFQAGGLGYILKCEANSDLFAGVRAVLKGRRFVSGSLQYGRDTTDW